MGRGKPLSGIFRHKAVLLAAIAVLFLAVYGFLVVKDVYLAVVDGCFYIGVIYLVAGMGLYIHNIGLFKTFRYWAYRMGPARRIKKEGAYDAKPMDLVAFTQFIMSQPKKPTAVFLIFGAAFLALSALILVLHGAF